MATKLKHKFIDAAHLVYNDLGDTIPIELAFHTILGQAFKNRKIRFGAKYKDLRFSVFWISPTRSGKGQLTQVMRDAFDMLGLTYAKSTTGSTDAGLLGGIDNDAHAYNVKHKKNPGDEDYKDPIIIGDLGTKDLILFEESKHLVNPRANAEDTLSLLQESQDTPGIVRKKLRSSIPVMYESTASIWATTYWIEKIKDVLMQQGFFHRLAIYQTDFDIDDSEKLRGNVLKLYLADTDYETKYRELLQQICDVIASKMSDKEEYMTVSSEALDELQKYQHEFHQIIRTYSGESIMILMGFSQTLIDLAIKMGAHYAILDNRKIIKPVDIIQGFGIMKKCVSTWITRLKIGDDPAKMAVNHAKFLSYLKRDFTIESGLLTFEMINCIRTYYRCGQSKARGILSDLTQMNYLRKKHAEIGNKISYFIVE